MSTPLRLAVIGAGAISRAHVNAFPHLRESVTLSAVCDKNDLAATALAAEFGAAVFQDHRQLLTRGKPDGVIITLPHFLHVPVAKDFLEAGVPALIEKPITCTGPELRELHEIASRKNLALVAGQMRRFGYAVSRVKAWRDASPTNFGELRSFDLVAQANIDGYTGGHSHHWIFDGTMAGGGVVRSFAIHCMDLLRFIGETDFAEVTAIGRFDPPFKNQAESQASVLFRMTNGATGSLHSNALAPRALYMDSLCLHGTHGTIYEVGSSMRYATTTGVSTKSWGDQYEGFIDAPDSNDPKDDPFVKQLLNFADAVRFGKRPALNTAEDNFNTIACIDAVAESLETGATVKVAKL
jgi:predicted dehydrogenase